jgi:HAD superfamily hydrolase (TIGR01509 family)
MRALQGVLFDVGYTLLDENPRLETAAAWCVHDLRERGRDVRPEAFLEAYRRACLAPRLASVFQQALEDVGLSAEEAAAYRRRLPWDAVPLVPYPDALQTVRRLRVGGVRVGVLANQPASARSDLVACGLAASCDGIWLSEEVGLHKPDPAFFRAALDAWGLASERVAYVGDRPDNDVGPARRLGMHAVRLRYGPHAGQPSSGPDEEPHADCATLADVAGHVLSFSGPAR